MAGAAATHTFASSFPLQYLPPHTRSPVLSVTSSHSQLARGGASQLRCCTAGRAEPTRQRPCSHQPPLLPRAEHRASCLLRRVRRVSGKTRQGCCLQPPHRLVALSGLDDAAGRLAERTRHGSARLETPPSPSALRRARQQPTRARVHTGGRLLTSHALTHKAAPRAPHAPARRAAAR